MSEAAYASVREHERDMRKQDESSQDEREAIVRRTNAIRCKSALPRKFA